MKEPLKVVGFTLALSGVAMIAVHRAWKNRSKNKAKLSDGKVALPARIIS